MGCGMPDRADRAAWDRHPAGYGRHLWVALRCSPCVWMWLHGALLLFESVRSGSACMVCACSVCGFSAGGCIGARRDLCAACSGVFAPAVRWSCLFPAGKRSACADCMCCCTHRCNVGADGTLVDAELLVCGGNPDRVPVCCCTCSACGRVWKAALSCIRRFHLLRCGIGCCCCFFKCLPHAGIYEDLAAC